MKIKDTINIEEAVRFGSDQRQALERNQRLFKIGIEYEFSIRKENFDGSDMEVFSPDQLDRAARQAYGEVLDVISEEISDFAQFIYLMDYGKLADIDDYENAVAEYEDGDSSELERLYRTFRDQTVSKMIGKSLSSSYVADGVPEVYETLDQFNKSLASMDMFARGIKQNGFYSLFDFVNEHAGRSYKMTQDKIVNIIHQELDLSDRVERRQSELLSTDPAYSPDEDTIIAFAESQIDPAFRSLIHSTTVDPSVPHGVEIISKPLSIENTGKLMKYMFGLIRRIGFTSQHTGLHVNISMTDFRKMDIDPLRVMALMDSDFFQNNSPSSKSMRNAMKKYEARARFSEINTERVNPAQVERIAHAYISGGFKEMEPLCREYIAMTSVGDPKTFGINFTSIFKNYNLATKRIEFRFFGGTDYETRYTEIMNDIAFLCYVILASVRGNDTRDYHKGLMRILNRISRRTHGMDFSSMINEIRRGTFKQDEIKI